MKILITGGGYYKFFKLTKLTRKEQFETSLNFFSANRKLLKSNEFIKKLVYSMKNKSNNEIY